MFIITILFGGGVLVSNQAFWQSPLYIVSGSSELLASFWMLLFLAGYLHTQYIDVGYSLFWKHTARTQVA